jgi:hypothetical protein
MQQWKKEIGEGIMSIARGDFRIPDVHTDPTNNIFLIFIHPCSFNEIKTFFFSFNNIQ